MRRAKAFFAFALLFAYSTGPDSFVNDGEAVHFIVDKAVGLCYLLQKLMGKILPKPPPGSIDLLSGKSAGAQMLSHRWPGGGHDACAICRPQVRR